MNILLGNACKKFGEEMLHNRGKYVYHLRQMSADMTNRINFESGCQKYAKNIAF